MTLGGLPPVSQEGRPEGGDPRGSTLRGPTRRHPGACDPREMTTREGLIIRYHLAKLVIFGKALMSLVRRWVLVLSVIGIATMKPVAQTQNVTLSGDLFTEWTRHQETMMRIADAMPEDKFGYKSTPAQRSYAEQILHVAGANVMFMKFLGGTAPAPAIAERNTSTFGLNAATKADVLKALGDSYDYGAAVLKEFNDQALLQPVQGPRFIGTATRARLVLWALTHEQDIYGQMVVYLRLNGIVPPASRRGGV